MTLPPLLLRLPYAAYTACTLNTEQHFTTEPFWSSVLHLLLGGIVWPTATAAVAPLPR